MTVRGVWTMRQFGRWRISDLAALPWASGTPEMGISG